MKLELGGGVLKQRARNANCSPESSVLVEGAEQRQK